MQLLCASFFKLVFSDVINCKQTDFIRIRVWWMQAFTLSRSLCFLFSTLSSASTKHSETQPRSFQYLAPQFVLVDACPEIVSSFFYRRKPGAPSSRSTFRIRWVESCCTQLGPILHEHWFSARGDRPDRAHVMRRGESPRAPSQYVFPQNWAQLNVILKAPNIRKWSWHFFKLSRFLETQYSSSEVGV